MSEYEITVDSELIQDLFSDENALKSLLEDVLNQILEAQQTEQIQAERYERSDDRRGHRNGTRTRTMNSRAGQLELEVPQTRHGNVDTEMFKRYQRSEQALLLSLMEMAVNGTSTRKVQNVTQQLCGKEFSKSIVSELCKHLEERVNKWNERDLSTYMDDGESKEYPFVLVDAMVIKVRRDGGVRPTSILIATGINDRGYREILGVMVGNSESEATWETFFSWLKERGLSGVEVVTSDAHEGLEKALRKKFQGALWQRCQVHMRRNILGKAPRHLQEEIEAYLEDIFEASDREEAREEFEAFEDEFGEKAEECVETLREGFEDVTAVLGLPGKYRRRIRSTNMVERLIEEVRRREKVIRIFPNKDSAWRYSGAVLVEIHEDWITSKRRYLDMTEYEEWKAKNRFEPVKGGESEEDQKEEKVG